MWLGEENKVNGLAHARSAAQDSGSKGVQSDVAVVRPQITQDTSTRGRKRKKRPIGAGDYPKEIITACTASYMESVRAAGWFRFT